MNKLSFSKTKKVEILMLFVAMAWGAAFPVMKDLLGSFSAYSLLSIRFLSAGIILSLIFFTSFFALTKSELKKGIYLGLTLSAAFILLIIGLQFTLASKTGFLVATNVVLVPIIESIIYRRKITRRTLLGIAICLIGVSLLTTTSTSGFNFGDFLVLLGTLAFSFQIILIDQLSPMNNPAIICIQLLVTGLISGAIALATHTFVMPDIFSRSLILNLTFVSLVATAFTVWAQTKFQHHITPTKVSFIFLLEPVFTMIFSYILINEKLILSEMLGASIILFGIVLYLRTTQ